MNTHGSFKTFKTFRSSLPIVAAALGKHCGVNVEMGGDEAFTNGETIHLPMMDADIRSPEYSHAAFEAERRVLGLLCHEAAHVRYTDMDAVRNAKAFDSELPASRFELALDNALEDVRIEKALCSEYLGTEGLLRAAHQPIVDRLTQSLRIKDRLLLPLGLLCHAEWKLLKRDWLQPLSEKLHDRMVKAYGAELTEGLERLSLKVGNAGSTLEVQRIRAELMALMKCGLDRSRNGSSPADNPPASRFAHQSSKNSSEFSSADSAHRERKGVDKSPDLSKGPTSDAGQCKEPNEKVDEQGYTDKSNAEDPRGAQPDARSIAESGSGNPSEDGQNGNSLSEKGNAQSLQELWNRLNDPVSNPLDLSSAFKKLKASSFSDQSGEGKAGSRSHAYLPPAKLNLNGSIRPIPRESAESATILGRSRLERAKSDSSQLRHALQGLVQADSREGVHLSDQGRRLQTSKLYRLAVGCSRVFVHRSEKRAPDTAVHLLLDMSGSMGGEGGDLALRSALGLVYGLQQIRGVNPAVSVFPGTACGRPEYATVPILRHGERLCRVDPMEIGAVCSWGNTPLYEALITARIELAKCREAAKAVIVVTDGRFFNPNCKKAVQALTLSGITVMGIQIAEENDLDELIPQAALIHDIADLKEALFGFAKQLLLRH